MAVHETVIDGIATLTMDNPPVSALNIADAYSLADKINSYGEQKEIVKVVLIRSSQYGFCAGVDIKEILNLPGNEGILKANHSCYEMFDAIHNSKIPVIASQSAGLSEIVIDNENGFLAPIDDSDKMANIAKNLLTKILLVFQSEAYISIEKLERIINYRVI